ncbi:MAG: MoxR family ATPase, partial [Pseudomonadota bacterium]
MAASDMASIQTDHGLVETDDPFAVHLAPQADFFETSGLQQLQYRALTYLTAGVPVHFRGPAGTGKTTLAMQIAASIGRPTAIISGDSWMTSSDLLGESKGVRTRQVVDRYVHSVRRTETESEEVWSDNILTRAIINGYTLIYDEFTRSTPEANNPLLMAFEERMLIIP